MARVAPRCRIQSVAFPAPPWSVPAAARWLAAHAFAHSPLDRTANYIRAQQFPPPASGTYRSHSLATPQGPVLIVFHTAAPQGSSSGRPKKKRSSSADLFRAGRETTDQELAAWGKKYISGFLGVRARSDFVSLFPDGKPLTPGASCILNLDIGDYARGGTHWTAVRVSSSAPLVLYFDAFGMPPPREVTLRARRAGYGILYPDIQYQGISETNCGQRSLAVLLYLAEAAKDGKELEAFGEIGHVYPAWSSAQFASM